MNIYASDFDTYMKQGIMYFNSSDYGQAKDLFKKALIIKQEDLNARYNLAVCFFKVNDYSKALEETRFILSMYPSDEPSIKLLEEIRRSSVNDLKLKIDSFKYEEKWYIELINIYFLNKEFREALDIFEKAKEFLPRSARLYEIAAKVYQGSGNFEKASENIEKAFHLAPDDPSIFESLKSILDEKTKYGQNNISKETIKKNEVDDIAETSYIKSNDYYRMKNWTAALENIEKAITLSKNNSIYLNFRDKIKEDYNISNEAEKLFTDGMKMFKIGRYHQAVSYLKKASETIPNNLNQNILNMKIMESYKNLEDYEKQIEYCFKILENDKTDIKVWIYLADSYYFIGDYISSRKHFSYIKENFKDYLNKYPNIDNNIEKRISDIKMKLFLPSLKNYFVYALLIILIFLIAYNSPIVKKRVNIKKAEEFFAKRSWSDVVELLETVRKYKFVRQKKIKIYKMLIFSYIQLRDVDQAEILLKEAEKIIAEDEELMSYYAMINLKKEIFTKEALYSYKVLFIKEPDNIRLLKIIVKYFWEKKRNPDFKPEIEIFDENKINILEKVFVHEKDNLEVLNLLGDEYKKAEIYNKNSLKVFNKLLEFDFENIAVHILVAKTYCAIGEYEKAIKEVKFVFRRDINNAEAHDIFKKSFIANGNLNQALIEYENLLQIDPGNYYISDNIKDLRKLRASYSETKKSIIEESEEEKFSRAKALFNDGEYNDAITIFNELFDNSFRKNDTGFYLTYAYLKKDMIESALKQYEKNNFDEELMERKLKELIYQIGRKLEENGDLENAVKMYDKICRIDISYRDVFERYENLALSTDET
ncbi:MAG: tetratricopeptide repeat protein [Candidatus Muirbacterium halophilum]|nr:tetratricopeptide repeat protein [Candidatus Muirbacterium halophilum]